MDRIQDELHAKHQVPWCSSTLNDQMKPAGEKFETTDKIAV